MKDRQRITSDDVRFIFMTIGLIFITHATAYLTHEYSHATTAWLLGWMRSPVGINYGSLTLSNILFQQDISDGVDYAPIFASGHGHEASLIAFDGPAIGNGVLYVLCFLLLRSTVLQARPVLSMFLFWLAIMGAGNVWSYAPLRTITTHADMALVAQGLGISTWLLLPVVTLPSLLIIWSVFARLLPLARRTFFARGPVTDTFCVIMTCYLYFNFFGHGGLDNSYGEVSALLSIFSVFILFPFVIISCLYSADVNASPRVLLRKKRLWPGGKSSSVPNTV
jgi:hypothetical protein